MLLNKSAGLNNAQISSKIEAVGPPTRLYLCQVSSVMRASYLANMVCYIYVTLSVIINGFPVFCLSLQAFHVPSRVSAHCNQFFIKCI